MFWSSDQTDSSAKPDETSQGEAAGASKTAGDKAENDFQVSTASAEHVDKETDHDIIQNIAPTPPIETNTTCSSSPQDSTTANHQTPPKVDRLRRLSLSIGATLATNAPGEGRSKLDDTAAEQPADTGAPMASRSLKDMLQSMKTDRNAQGFSLAGAQPPGRRASMNNPQNSQLATENQELPSAQDIAMSVSNTLSSTPSTKNVNAKATQKKVPVKGKALPKAKQKPAAKRQSKAAPSGSAALSLCSEIEEAEKETPISEALSLTSVAEDDICDTSASAGQPAQSKETVCASQAAEVAKQFRAESRKTVQFGRNKSEDGCPLETHGPITNDELEDTLKYCKTSLERKSMFTSNMQTGEAGYDQVQQMAQVMQAVKRIQPTIEKAAFGRRLMEKRIHHIKNGVKNIVLEEVHAAINDAQELYCDDVIDEDTGIRMLDTSEEVAAILAPLYLQVIYWVYLFNVIRSAIELGMFSLAVFLDWGRPCQTGEGAVRMKPWQWLATAFGLSFSQSCTNWYAMKAIDRWYKKYLTAWEQQQEDQAELEEGGTGMGQQARNLMFKAETAKTNTQLRQEALFLMDQLSSSFGAFFRHITTPICLWWGAEGVYLIYGLSCNFTCEQENIIWLIWWNSCFYMVECGSLLFSTIYFFFKWIVMHWNYAKQCVRSLCKVLDDLMGLPLVLIIVDGFFLRQPIKSDDHRRQQMAWNIDSQMKQELRMERDLYNLKEKTSKMKVKLALMQRKAQRVEDEKAGRNIRRSCAHGLLQEPDPESSWLFPDANPDDHHDSKTE